MKFFKVLISITAIGLILMLTIPIKGALSTPPTKEVKEKKETKIQKIAQDIEEITGLIIEKTMTKIGYEFYENFFSIWEAPKGITGYNIYINEKASPMWGSLIYINVNDNLIWRGLIRPRSEDIETAIRNSIEVVKKYLYQYEEIRKQAEEGGDMVGSGIY